MASATQPSTTPGRLATRLFGTWTSQLTSQTLRADALAAVLGAILVLPQGIAFATLAGLPPQYGLYTAMVPCVIAALFGSSRHVVSGPTNANSLALFAMLAPLALPGSDHYIELALAVTVIVGAMQLAVGTLRLGALANFISPAALLGFMSGAAVLIAIHALKDFLDLRGGSSHGAGATLVYLATNLLQANPAAIAVAMTTLAVAALVRRFARQWPFMLIGLAAGTALAALANAASDWQVPVIGVVPAPLPPFHVPRIDWSIVPELLGLASALTIVALGQSIAIAKAIADRSGQRISANREFIGQGLSNVIGGFFSSYVSCGSLNRSAPNFEAGARTPLAAVFSAILLLALIAVSAPLLALIPMAAIAGLLLLVALMLFDLPRWKRLQRWHPTEFGIAAATLVATLAIRLEIAILLGTILSLMHYLYRTATPAMRTMGFDTMAPERRFVVVDDNPRALPECPQLKLLRMEGSVYFGAAQHVSDRLHDLRAGPDAQKHLLVMGKSMNFVDIAGAEVWEREMHARRAIGGDLYFHRPRPQVIEMWERTGFIDALGRDHIFPDKHTAIAAIYTRLDPAVCLTCPARVTWECRASVEQAAPVSGPPSASSTPA